MAKEIILEIKSNIDGGAIGNTSLFTTSATKGRLYVEGVLFSLQEASGLISIPSVSIGTNAVNYNNILSVTSLENLNTIEETIWGDLEGQVTNIPASTPIFVRVSVSAIATTYKFRVHLFGHYYKD